MKAIILAAGYGKRLKPLTDMLPKPLMPVIGRPLLRHIIMKLKNCGVTETGINLHHNAHMVNQFLEHEAMGISIRTSYEKNILGVAGGIGNFRKFIGEEKFFLVHNGDILSNIPLEKLIDFYRSELPLCIMVLHDHPPYNNVSIDETGNIVDIRNTLSPVGSVKKLAYTGISLMDTRIFKYIPGGPADLVPVLLDIIREKKGLIRALVLNGYAWSDIGTAESYLAAHNAILLKRKPLVDKSLLPGSPVFFGRNTVAEDGVELQGFISTGKNCLLKKGCFLKNCVLWDDVVIEKNTFITNSIVGKGWIVNAD